MSLTRFSVSLEDGLVRRFDEKIKSDGCPTRSKAIGDLIRESLVEKEWTSGAGQVAGAIVIVYDHHRPGLARRLTTIQHNFYAAILSTQHQHLDHDNCLEIIAVRGKPIIIDALVKEIKSVKGLKYISLAAGTTGEELE